MTEFCRECGRPKPVIPVDKDARKACFDYIENKANNGDMVDLLDTIRLEIRKRWFKD